MDKQEEIWRPIKTFEGLYEVSNRGRVRSVDRWVIYKDGSKHFWKGQILKPRQNETTGYLQVNLCRDGKQRTFRIHRLVAEAWLDNPMGKPEVNHLDEDKTNNDVYNLEWSTAKENINFGTGNKRRAESQLNGSCSKPVQALDPKTGQVVLEFPSTAEAQRNGFVSGHISNCCQGKKWYNTHRGYRWRYKPASNYSRMLAIYDIALEQCRRKAKTVGTPSEFEDFRVKIC